LRLISPNHLVISKAVARKLQAKDGITEVIIENINLKRRHFDVDKLRKNPEE